jgi:hypothetical protein
MQLNFQYRSVLETLPLTTRRMSQSLIIQLARTNKSFRFTTIEINKEKCVPDIPSKKSCQIPKDLFPC